MRKIFGLAIIAGLGLVTPALAETATADAAGARALAAKIGEMGYDVQSVRERHGRYHANLLDRESGGAVHAEFRIADGELMSARLAAGDNASDVRDHDGDRSHHARARHDR
jgi:hypothetical protein